MKGIEQYLGMIQNNPQLMNNQTVQNVFQLRKQNDIKGLMDLYMNTCSTTGNTPNQNVIDFYNRNFK